MANATDPLGFSDADMGKSATEDRIPSVSEQLTATVELLKEKKMLVGKFARAHMFVLETIDSDRSIRSADTLSCSTASTSLKGGCGHRRGSDTSSRNGASSRS